MEPVGAGPGRVELPAPLVVTAEYGLPVAGGDALLPVWEVEEGHASCPCPREELPISDDLADGLLAWTAQYEEWMERHRIWEECDENAVFMDPADPLVRRWRDDGYRLRDRLSVELGGVVEVGYYDELQDRFTWPAGQGDAGTAPPSSGPSS